MIEEKVVPHMMNIVKLLKHESSLKLFLETILKNKFDKENAIILLMTLPSINQNYETSKRCIGSLYTYSFLIINDFVELSDYSKEYLDGKLSYPDYILTCLSSNLEWAYFLQDIYDIIDKFRPSLKKSEIILQLKEEGYDISNKKTIGRYLSEILPVLDIAEVIKYDNYIASTGKRNRKDILYYARVNQRELLNMLQMAERRRISKPTLRRIYRATVKAHLPLRKWRALTSNTQKELEDIRAIDIKKSEKLAKKIIDSKWQLKDPLWKWQKKFLELWLENKKGIVKVVTGAGKTHLAMAIIQKLKAEYEDLHITIVVPTIVLLEQWYENLTQKLQVSPNEIGLKGGGYSDTFQKKKILIIVINSAIKGGFIEKETNGIKHNLLIVDECHRAGAKEFRKIFKAKRDWELGLSATPEREMDNAFKEVLETEIGPIIGTYTYNNALEDNIIPKFDIYNYAVILNNQEKNRYTKLTKEIQKIVERLKYRYPQLNDSKVKMEIVLKNLQKKYPDDKDLFLYFQKTKERKNEILYPAENRKKFVRNIFDRVLEKKENVPSVPGDSPISVTPQDRVIVFHELIHEINSLFIELDSPYVSIYHSGFPNSLNRIGLDLYQSGQTKVLLSVKALIEGVDVPKTNLGIIMASSSSQTQRIQSLGRVLRKAEGKNETKLFIVYVKNTTDERIYRKTNWDEIVGKGNIVFRMWTEFGEVQIDEPQINEIQGYVELDFIDENMLEEGCIYPGKYEGESYSFDSNGKLFKKTNEGRSYIDENVYGFWQVFRKYKPSGGKLMVNELGHVLIKLNKKGKFETIYLGNIKNYVKDFRKYLFHEI